MRGASNSKKIWRVIYPPLLYFAIQIMVQVVFSIVLMGIFQANHNYESYGSLEAYSEASVSFIYQYAIASTLVSALISIPILAGFFRGDNRRRFEETGCTYGKMKPVNFILVAILGAACSGGFNKLISILAACLPASYIESFQKVAEALNTGNIWTQVIATAIVVPIAEELVFRGLVYQRLKDIVSTKAAMIVSGLIFGIAHGNFIQGVYAFILGIFLSWIYEKCKTIWAPIVFHMMANGFSQLLEHWNVFQSASTGFMILLMIIELTITFLICRIINKTVKIEKNEEVKKEDEYIW